MPKKTKENVCFDQINIFIHFFLLTFPNSVAGTDRALTLVGDSGRDTRSRGINIRVYQRPGVDVQNSPATEVFLNMFLHNLLFL